MTSVIDAAKKWYVAHTAKPPVRSVENAADLALMEACRERFASSTQKESTTNGQGNKDDNVR